MILSYKLFYYFFVQAGRGSSSCIQLHAVCCNVGIRWHVRTRPRSVRPSVTHAVSFSRVSIITTWVGTVRKPFRIRAHTPIPMCVYVTSHVVCMYVFVYCACTYYVRMFLKREEKRFTHRETVNTYMV